MIIVSGRFQVNKQSFMKDLGYPQPHPNAFAPRIPMNDQPRGMHISVNSNSQPQKRSSFDSLFDETMTNFGLGSFFFPMEFADSSSESDSDDDNRRQHSSPHTTVFDDGNVHVSQIGDGTAITLRSDNDSFNRHDARAHPTQNEFGSGFTHVHHVEL